MTALMDMSSWVEPQGPSSSIIRAYDRHDSRSVDEFDPNLQFSSPRPNFNPTMTTVDDVPLEHDVDWKPIRAQVSRSSGNTSSPGSQESRTIDVAHHSLSHERSVAPRSQLTSPCQPTIADHSFLDKMLLKPHKTFFHIDEMLDAEFQLFKHQPKVIFELFARVSYSSRANFHHKQYFQFRNLFRQWPSCVNGVLLG